MPSLQNCYGSRTVLGLDDSKGESQKGRCPSFVKGSLNPDKRH
jgi:hypothetical protein